MQRTRPLPHVRPRRPSAPAQHPPVLALARAAIWPPPRLPSASEIKARSSPASRTVQRKFPCRYASAAVLGPPRAGAAWPWCAVHANPPCAPQEQLAPETATPRSRDRSHLPTVVVVRCHRVPTSVGDAVADPVTVARPRWTQWVASRCHLGHPHPPLWPYPIPSLCITLAGGTAPGEPWRHASATASI